MKKTLDIVGQKFGRLTVVEKLDERDKWGSQIFRCQCECLTDGRPAEVIVKGSDLISGHTSSCGCIQREKVGSMRRTHGLSGTPENRIWCHMNQRCHNPNDNGWEKYGGRGIEVCAEWRYSFETFLKDMGQRPSPNHSIDRIDVNGNYNRENCRWATLKEQARNKRNTVYVEFKGEKRVLRDLLDELSIGFDLYRGRLKQGWSVERALSTPVQKTGQWRSSFETFYNNMGPRPSPAHSVDRIDVDGPYSLENCRWATWSEQQRNKRSNIYVPFRGERRLMVELTEESGIHRDTFTSRLEHGWSVEDALTKPIQRHTKKTPQSSDEAGE